MNEQFEGKVEKFTHVLLKLKSRKPKKPLDGLRVN